MNPLETDVPSSRSRMSRHTVLGVTLIGLALLITAGDTAAQACAAIPETDRVAFAGARFVTHFGGGDVPEWGAEAGLVLPGSVAIRAGYLWEPESDDFDEVSTENEGHVLSTLAVRPVPIGDVDLCPGLGLEYEIRARDGDDPKIWKVPLGLGIGRSIRVSPSVTLTPFAFPQAVYVTGRPEVVIADDMQVLRETEAVDGRLDFGGVLTMGRFYGSATVRLRADFEPPPDAGTFEFERPLQLTVGVRF